MSAQFGPAVAALTLVAGPAAVGIARSTNEPFEREVLCIVENRAPVERRFGGERDVAAHLDRGTEVTVLDERRDSTKIRYRVSGKTRTGWVASKAVGPCSTSSARNDGTGAEKVLPPVIPPVSTERAARSANPFHPFGEPRGAIPGGVLLRKSAYDCMHDPSLKYCRWVGYCYQPTARSSPRHKGDFFPEPLLSPGERAERDDYAGAYKKDLSGFDKGHLAPDATIKAFGLDAQKETYSLANITPQYSRMNQGIWRELEDEIRKWATESDPVCVETGPVFYPNRPVQRLDGPNRLPVPHAYYAIVTQGPDPAVISFMIPNEPVRRSVADVMEFAESVDTIEATVGLDFLADLPDALENSIEAARAEELWE